MHKSPLLIVSLLVALALFAGLIGPHFVDWSNYRSRLEADISERVGRPVKIGGMIDVKLLPAPSLTLGQVRLAGIEGDQSTQLSVKRISARLALAPLLRGRFNLTAFELTEPVVSLGIDKTGHVGLAGVSLAGLPALHSLDAVRLDRVVIKNASIKLTDARHGATLALNSFNAEISAPFLSGPYRLNGDFRLGNARRRFDISTGRIRNGKDGLPELRLRVRVRPGENAAAGQVNEDIVFDGRVRALAQNPQAIGTLTVSGIGAQGTQDQSGSSPNITVNANVVADMNQVLFSELTVQPEEKAAFALAGTILAKWGASREIEATIRTNHLNLTDLGLVKGGAGLADWIPKLTELLSVAERMKLTGKVSLDASIVTVDDQKIDDVGLTLQLGSDAFYVQRALATFPGHSRLTATGQYKLGTRDRAIKGSYALRALDARAMMRWAMPGASRVIEAAPRTIGNLSLKGEFEVDRFRVLLNAAEFRAGQVSGQFGLNYVPGPRPGVGLRLAIREFDIERDLMPSHAGRPDKKASENAAADFSVRALADMFAEIDANLAIQIEKLNYRGVTAGKIAANVKVFDRKVTVKRLSVGDAAGATLTLRGELKDIDGPMSGQLSANITAADLDRVRLTYLELLPELAAQRGLIRFARSASPSQMTVTVSINTPPGQETEYDVRLTGALADSRFSGRMRYRLKGLDFKRGTVDAHAELSNPSSAVLLRQTGISVTPVGGNRAGIVRASLKGPLDGDIVLAGGLQAYGASAIAKGHGRTSATGVAIEAQIGLTSDNAHPLISALGLSTYRAGAVLPVRLTGLVAGKAGEFVLTGLSGQLGRSKMEVNGTINFNSSRPKIRAEATLDKITLPAVRSAKPVNSKRGRRKPVSQNTWSSEIIDTSFLGLADAEILAHVQVLKVGSALRLSGVTAKFSLVQGDVKLHQARAVMLGGRLKLDGKLTTRAGQLAVAGRYALKNARLENLLVDANGDVFARGGVAIKGDFRGHGRTVLGIVSSLRGEGSLKVRDGSLRGFNPETFNRAIEGLRNETELDVFIKGILIDGEMAFSQIDSVFTMSSGLVRVADMTLKGRGAHGKVVSFVDLPTYRVDSEWHLALSDHPKAPPVTLIFSGALDAPVRAFDVRGLRQHLVMKRLKNQMKELEDHNREAAVLREKAARVRSSQQPSPPPVEAAKPLQAAVPGKPVPTPSRAIEKTPGEPGGLRFKKVVPAPPPGPPLKIGKPEPRPAAGLPVDLQSQPDAVPRPPARRAPRRRPRRVNEIEGLND